MQKIRLEQKFAEFSDHWSPRIIGELNGQHVKLAKFLGPFDWHHHASEDELFLVVQGSFCMDYRDELGETQSLSIAAGEMLIVPRGTEHRPRADNECHVLLFEPIGTLNTGNVRSEKTVENPAELRDDPRSNSRSGLST
jgi:mannose-6-phosphate isomerase-like protein (cupin superfamily)